MGSFRGGGGGGRRLTSADVARCASDHHDEAHFEFTASPSQHVLLALVTEANGGDNDLCFVLAASKARIAAMISITLPSGG